MLKEHHQRCMVTDHQPYMLEKSSAKSLVIAYKCRLAPYDGSAWNFICGAQSHQQQQKKMMQKILRNRVPFVSKALSDEAFNDD